MRMTVEQYGAAIRAAFEQGYLDGYNHPHKRRVIERAHECSAGFWTRVLSGLRERMYPEADAVDPSWSTPDALTPPIATPETPHAE